MRSSARSLCACAAVLLMLSGCSRLTGVGESEVATAESESMPVIKIETTEAVSTEAETEETEAESEAESDPLPEGKKIIAATDIHYLSRTLTDGGSVFSHMVEHGDGKVVTYVEEIVDAFLADVIRQQPDVLILSGDLTLNGELRSHKELAEKLYVVKEAGIPVLVIPGNHDINNRQASEYRGEDRLPAEYTSPEAFREIYKDFGYDDALSEDVSTLSYVYELDDDYRFLMLDTCQYRPYAKVGGAILSDTYDWIEMQLEASWDDEADMIPVGHHNLLDESEIYVDDCTIEHGEQLVDILNDWSVSLFLSGHLHVQHAKQSEDGYGIWEMVTSSLTTPSCQYGVLVLPDDGGFVYQTRTVDVERWAKEHDRQEEDLLAFEAFKEPFLRRVFYNQSYDALLKLETLTERQRKEMSDFYSDLNYHYYQGTVYKIKAEAQKDPAFKLWQNEGSVILLGDYVQYIIEDGKWDYNYVKVSPPRRGSSESSE